jgi:hypothetical protein
MLRRLNARLGHTAQRPAAPPGATKMLRSGRVSTNAFSPDVNSEQSLRGCEIFEIPCHLPRRSKPYNKVHVLTGRRHDVALL